MSDPTPRRSPDLRPPPAAGPVSRAPDYFSQAFRASPALMAIARTEDGRILEVNDSFLRASGHTRAEVLGRTSLELNIWPQPADRLAFIEQLQRTGHVHNHETVFLTKGHEPRHVSLSADIFELDGASCMLITAIDITERRRREQVQEATYQISRVLLAGGDLDALFAEVHRLIGTLMPARNFYVALLNRDDGLIYFPYFVDEFIPAAPPRKPDNGLTEHVLQTGQAMLATQAELPAILGQHRAYTPLERPAAIRLAAPLLIDGQAIGVIAVQDYHNPHAYGEEEKRLMQFVADQGAAAVHRRLSDARERESQEFFVKSFQTTPALMIVARVSDGHILEANSGFEQASGFTRAEALGRNTLDLGLWVDTVQRDLFIGLLRRDGLVRDFEGVFRTKQGGYRHLLLNADGFEMRGTKCMLTIGIDITERRRRERVQDATYQISRAVLAGGDLAALFAEVHRIVAGLFSAKNFYVALLDPDGERLTFPYYVDENSSTPAPSHRSEGRGLTHYVLDTATPLLASREEVLQRVKAAGGYQPRGTASAVWLGVPLIAEGRAIGVLTVQDYHNPAAYGEEEQRLLMFVADQAAAAVLRRQSEEALRRSEASRRASQEYFVKSFQASPALMAVVRLSDSRILEANTAFLTASGYARPEVIGRTAGELNLWTEPAQRALFVEQLQAAGQVRDYETVFVTKQGEQRYVLSNTDLVEFNGEPCHVVTAIDITDRHRRELVQAATFQISQAVLAGGDLTTLFAGLHRIIAGLMPARNLYVALLSPDGSLLSFPYFVDENIAAPPTRKPGYGLTEYVLHTGKALLTTADELTVLLREHSQYAPVGKSAALWLGAPLLIAGRAIGVIALQDYHNGRAYGEEEKRLLLFVAEQVAAAVHRRQAEEALQRAEHQYRGIFENALEGLYQTTAEGRFRHANPALARMFGYATPTGLLEAINDIGRQLYVNPGRRQEFLKLVELGDEVTDFESEVYRQDGARFWISESVRTMRNAAGEISHFEGVAIDITARREAARALQEAKEAADAANRAKSHFLASMSHELRTPLNGILGYTQILHRDPALTARQRDGVAIINQSADHLLALINDVLDLAKIEARKLVLHPAEFALPEFVRAVEAVFLPRAREKNLLLETDFAPDLPPVVVGDAQRLRQALFNLLSNAVKFTRQGGVVFSVEKSGDRIRFSISDTGPGIAAEEQPRLFEPFGQIGDPRLHAEGTGLGLNVSRGIVEQMGGALQVESRAGWGSRFWFEVPLPATAAGTTVSRATPSRRITGYEGPRRAILVADDHPTNASLLVDLLEPIGFTVTTAADGEQAVARARAQRPDLVLMDLRMPGVDGYAATRAIREVYADNPPKIIGVSASTFEPDRVACHEAGCAEFLAKPFHEDQLFAAVERQLGLHWLYAEPVAAEPAPSFPEIKHAPAPADAELLFALASKGDVVGVRAFVQQLAERDPSLAPFAQGVTELAARFKMKAIRQFVSRYRAVAEKTEGSKD